MNSALNVFGAMPYNFGVVNLARLRLPEGKKEATSMERAVMAAITANIVEELVREVCWNSSYSNSGIRPQELMYWSAMNAGSRGLSVWLGAWVAKRIDPDYTWQRSMTRLCSHQLTESSLMKLCFNQRG